MAARKIGEGLFEKIYVEEMGLKDRCCLILLLTAAECHEIDRPNCADFGLLIAIAIAIPRPLKVTKPTQPSGASLTEPNRSPLDINGRPVWANGWVWATERVRAGRGEGGLNWLSTATATERQQYKKLWHLKRLCIWVWGETCCEHFPEAPGSRVHQNHQVHNTSWVHPAVARPTTRIAPSHVNFPSPSYHSFLLGLGTTPPLRAIPSSRHRGRSTSTRSERKTLVDWKSEGSCCREWDTSM